MAFLRRLATKNPVEPKILWPGVLQTRLALIGKKEMTGL